MKVLNFVRPENGLTEDPVYYLNFEKYESIARDCYFFMADFYGDLYSGNYNDKEKVVLTLEEPNFCVAGGMKETLHHHANVILTLCPYMAEVYENRTFVFFPFSEDYIPPKVKKDIDISYFGSMPLGIPWSKYVTNVMSKYEYRYGYYNDGNVQGCSYLEKINLLARSKIAPVHSLCNPPASQIAAFRAFPRMGKSPAFSHLESGLMPQIKSRTFEAAFANCLILCQRDPWNVIEHFFTPDEDFLYFDDEADLDKKVAHALTHYNEFEDMVSSAHKKAIENYTTKHFVERHLL
jgi:hypothetical protein